MSWERLILHVDMDAFYASVEQRDDPMLRGLPVVVGGGGPRGVVAAASYRAREFGIRSAMPGAEARRRCPDAIFVRPRMSRYREVSKQVFELFRQRTPLVQGLSLDEAFLDLSADPVARADPRATAAGLKRDILERTGLTASVGVATNKLVAKIASDLDKPDGLTMVPADRIQDTLDPLPISRLWGVGPQTGSRLQRLGLTTFRDVRRAPDEALRQVFGRYHLRMRERASGVDRRAVESQVEDRSISAEETFPSDLPQSDTLSDHLATLCETVARRLRKAGLVAGTVALKLRDPAFNTHSRQRPVVPPTDQTALLHGLANDLLAQWFEGRPGARLRLLGVSARDLRPADQMDLFGATGRDERVADAVRARFGDDAIGTARSLRGKRYDDDPSEP
jgi:DNA polymerase IV